MRVHSRGRDTRPSRRLAGPRIAAAAALLAVALLACSTTAPSGAPGASGATGQPGTAGPGEPRATRGPAPTDCRQRIEGARLDSAESMDAVNACRFTVEGLHAARDVLGAGGTDDAMWAAIWVYAPGAADPAPLRPILTREDPSLRALAAAGLVALGDVTGFDVLAAGAKDKTWLAGSHPPITIREFVVITLGRYVTADGAPFPWKTYEEYLTLDQRWVDWLTANKARLAFDTSTARWILR